MNERRSNETPEYLNDYSDTTKDGYLRNVYYFVGYAMRNYKTKPTRMILLHEMAAKAYCHRDIFHFGGYSSGTAIKRSELCGYWQRVPKEVFPEIDLSTRSTEVAGDEVIIRTIPSATGDL
jgi:hypothetical protein